MASTLNASTLLVVPLAPLAGSLIAGIFGTTFGGNRIGRGLSHTATILGVLVAFIISALTLKAFVVQPFFMQSRTFSSVFRAMCGHLLHEHVIPGTPRNVCRG